MIEGLEKLGTMHVTLAERVYQELRRAVIHQQLAPGSQLRSQELAQTLRVSRTPVKEALFRLRQEGLVDYSERQGFFVTKVTTDGLPGLFEARLMCELFAVRKALPTLSDENVRPLREALQKARQIVAKGMSDTAAWYDADQELHCTVVALAGNQRILAWYTHLRDLTQGVRVLGTVHRPSSDYSASLQDHEIIVDAIVKRDLAAVEAALRRHSQNAVARVLAQVPVTKA